MDFTPFFEQYEALVAEADAAFQAVSQREPEGVTCEEGCADCCHALFDLSLIEALYLNHQFNRQYQGLARHAILRRADEADRENHIFKRKIFKASEAGVSSTELLDEVAKQRIRCPLLEDDNRCAIYSKRPVTCRVYGAPLAIAGQGSTCGQSGFQKGGSYPTINMDALQDRLMLLSQALVDAMPTKHNRLAEVLVPVSMALMNTYDDGYLGIVEQPEAKQGCGDGEAYEWTLGKPEAGASAADAFGAPQASPPQENKDGQG